MSYVTTLMYCTILHACRTIIFPMPMCALMACIVYSSVREKNCPSILKSVRHARGKFGVDLVFRNLIQCSNIACFKGKNSEKNSLCENRMLCKKRVKPTTNSKTTFICRLHIFLCRLCTYVRYTC